MSSTDTHSERTDEAAITADVYSKEKRSEVMAKVRSRDTKPELAVRRVLHAMGYRFRLAVTSLPGKPDIVLPKYRSVVFVHGCFWHQHEGCNRAKMPQSNAEYWRKKLLRNVQRDKEAIANLQAAGWHTLIVWECEIRDAERLAERLSTFLEGSPN